MRFWDDGSRIDELKRLYAEGLTMAEIAKAMGAPTTNVVVGKINRLGLRRTTGIENAPGWRNGCRKRGRPRKPADVQPVRTAPSKPSIPPRPAPLLPIASPVSVDEADHWAALLPRPGQCKFAMSDDTRPPYGSFQWCPNAATHGSWCAHHHAVIINPRPLSRLGWMR